MPELPSWQTSTLSQAFIGSLIAYWGILSVIAIGIVWGNTDVEKAKIVVGWASALEAAVSSAYLAIRKTNGGGNGEPPKPA